MELSHRVRNNIIVGLYHETHKYGLEELDGIYFEMLDDRDLMRYRDDYLSDIDMITNADENFEEWEIRDHLDYLQEHFYEDHEDMYDILGIQAI